MCTWFYIVIGFAVIYVHALNVTGLSALLLLSHPGLGWLYVFSSCPPRPAPRLPRPPQQKLLPLTSKSFELNLRYLAQKYMVWGNVLDDLSMTFTQGHGCGIDKQKFDCMCDEVWTNLRITTKYDNLTALFMVITWFDFEEVMFETFILANCPQNNGGFSRSNPLLAIYIRNGWSDWCETERKCIDWILGTIYDLDLWPHSWPWPWMFQGQISKWLYLKNCWSDWHKMKMKLMIMGRLYDLAPLTIPMTLTLEFQGQSLK